MAKKQSLSKIEQTIIQFNKVCVQYAITNDESLRIKMIELQGLIDEFNYGIINDKPKK
jgi:hypothetical protein